MEEHLWQTWTESKSREDGGALCRAAEKNLDIRLDGKKLKQRDNFVYVGGAVCGDGGTETEIGRRIQAGASAWRKVVGGCIHIASINTNSKQFIPFIYCHQ